MKQTGELLRQARENANLSLSEVALATKINPKILNAIEQGEPTHLPSKTFLKGFIRSYALYLKLDADEVMKVFNEETGENANREPAAASDIREPTPAPVVKRKLSDGDEVFSGVRVIAVAVIVVLIGLIIGVRELIEKYQRETVIDQTAELNVSPLEEEPEEERKEAAPVAKAPAPEPEPTPTPAPPAATEAKVETTPAAEPAPATPAPAPEAPAPAPVAVTPTPVPAPQPAPVPAPTPAPPAVTPAPAPTPVAAPTPAPTPTPAPSSTASTGRREIIIEALDKVEVKFQVNGQPKKLSLGPTQVHTIIANGPMVLDVSDGGAVNIILNGRERGVPGDLGKPKQVKIP